MYRGIEAIQREMFDKYRRDVEEISSHDYIHFPGMADSINSDLFQLLTNGHEMDMSEDELAQHIDCLQGYEEEIAEDAKKLEEILGALGFEKKFDYVVKPRFKREHTGGFLDYRTVYCRDDGDLVEILTDYNWKTGERGICMYRVDKNNLDAILKNEYNNPILTGVRTGVASGVVSATILSLLTFLAQIPAHWYLNVLSVSAGITLVEGVTKWYKNREPKTEYEVLSTENVLLDLLQSPDDIKNLQVRVNVDEVKHILDYFEMDIQSIYDDIDAGLRNHNGHWIGDGYESLPMQKARRNIK